MQHQLCWIHTEISPLQCSLLHNFITRNKNLFVIAIYQLPTDPSSWRRRSPEPNLLPSAQAPASARLSRAGSALAQAERQFAKWILTACQRGGRLHAHLHAVSFPASAKPAASLMSPAACTSSSPASAQAPRGHLPRLNNTFNQWRLGSSYCKQKGIQNSLTSNRYWILTMERKKS